MPASPIVKKVELPDNWVQLQKMFTSDQATGCYWSVWFDPPTNMKNATAWLMWCAIGDDPSVNDSWGHAEEIDDSCSNVLTTIESVYGVSFHDSIWVEMGTGNKLPCGTGPVAIGRGETWDGE